VDEKADTASMSWSTCTKRKCRSISGTRRTCRATTLYSPVKAQSIESRVGLVKAELITHLADPKIGGKSPRPGALRQAERIDIINDLKAVNILHSDSTRIVTREFYYAFPVKVDNFNSRVEYPVALSAHTADQMRYGSHDYLMANLWRTLQPRVRRDHGAVEAQTVSFGEIRYNKFYSTTSRPTPTCIVTRGRTGCGLLTSGPTIATTLHYSFTSHAGDWTAARPRGLAGKWQARWWRTSFPPGRAGAAIQPCQLPFHQRTQRPGDHAQTERATRTRVDRPLGGD